MKGTGTSIQGAQPERTRFKLRGRSVKLDRRIHAARGDLADLSLAGTLFSAHYARAVEMTCIAPGTPVLASSSLASETVSQLLRGESFHILDVTADWAWGFCGHDGYVGYVRRDALDARETPTHRVTAPSAPVFAEANIKSRIVDYWPAGARFAAREEGAFLATAEGYVHARHGAPAAALELDWIAVARTYLGQPYVWGGRGHGGVDCSGLIQIALGRCGMSVPRDTDLQRESIGRPIADDEPLRRGDLVYFPGHVGFMVDGNDLLHANAWWMATMVEPLADVVDRLRADHEQPVLARRRIS